MLFWIRDGGSHQSDSEFMSYVYRDEEELDINHHGMTRNVKNDDPPQPKEAWQNNKKIKMINDIGKTTKYIFYKQPMSKTCLRP